MYVCCDLQQYSSSVVCQSEFLFYVSYFNPFVGIVLITLTFSSNKANYVCLGGFVYVCGLGLLSGSRLLANERKQNPSGLLMVSIRRTI